MKIGLPDFDVLVNMARHDPESLESLRVKLTQSVIERASSAQQKRRLEGLQFKIDVERNRAGSPLMASIRISEMMCESLKDLHHVIVDPESFPALTCEPAPVLPFRRAGEG